MHRARATAFSLARFHDVISILLQPSDSFLDAPVAPGLRTSADDLRVRVELLDVSARSGIFAGWLTIGATAFVHLLFGEASGRPLAIWTIGMIAISVVRIAICAIWRRARAAERALGDGRSGFARTDPVRLRRWEWTHAGLALGGGLAWAALVLLGMPGVERSAMLVGFTLTVALVFASSLYATNRAALLLFAAPIVIAQEINLLRLSIAHHDSLAIGWLGLVIVLYVMPRVTSVSLRDGLVARIAHERRASEQAALLETAPLGILVVRDLRIVACNDALRKILGYAEKEELLGRSVRILFPDDDAWKQAVQNGLSARQGPTPPHIARRRRADGSSIDVMINVATIPGSSGDAYIGIYEDVHDRMAIEKGYRHAVRMQRLVFESAGEGIAIVGDGIIEQANQALSDLVGVPVVQLTDRPLQSIFEDPQGWADIEERFQRLGNTLKLERKIRRSDGRAMWANVTGCLVDAPVDGGRTQDAVATVKRSIWILADLSVQKQKEAENWHHANHDVVTGLPNRRFLQDRLDQALAFARRNGRRVAVVELDLDGFKSVNDAYGHRFGDAVLEEVARRLSMVVRELDTVGRWGGDEFVLVLKEIESHEVVEETVKRVIARLSEPIVYMNQNLSIGASIGIALFPDHGDEAEVLMLAADLAMYESKSSGGNTWRFASPAAQTPRGEYRPAPAGQTTAIGR